MCVCVCDPLQASGKLSDKQCLDCLCFCLGHSAGGSMGAPVPSSCPPSFLLFCLSYFFIALFIYFVFLLTHPLTCSFFSFHCASISTVSMNENNELRLLFFSVKSKLEYFTSFSSLSKPICCYVLIFLCNRTSTDSASLLPSAHCCF